MNQRELVVYGVYYATPDNRLSRFPIEFLALEAGDTKLATGGLDRVLIWHPREGTCSDYTSGSYLVLIIYRAEPSVVTKD